MVKKSLVCFYASQRSAGEIQCDHKYKGKLVTGYRLSRVLHPAWNFTQSHFRHCPRNHLKWYRQQ